MAITLKNVGEILWPHYAPLWREHFKRWGFDADKWSDDTLKAAVRAYSELEVDHEALGFSIAIRDLMKKKGR